MSEIENQNKTLDNEVAVSPDDDASIMYTSGSTGHPKGVVSSHRSVMFAPFYWIALQTLLKESSDEENLEEPRPLGDYSNNIILQRSWSKKFNSDNDLGNFRISFIGKKVAIIDQKGIYYEL